MISIEESNQIISQLVPITETEQVELHQSLGRVLAQNIVADIDQPNFDKSAMDGYACKRKDLHLPLKMTALVAAGTLIDKELADGECYRIFTGAPVPCGADCVIMQENTSLDAKGFVHFNAENTKNNICYKAEDGKAGDCILPAGTRIKTQHLAIMAAYGVVKPVVFRRPRVAFFCSGSELIEPAFTPEAAMIRNTNASQLMGQLAETGAEWAYKGILTDDLAEVCSNIESNIAANDVIIITGGASVGDFDLIPQALKNIGAHILIDALNMQPGKPVLLATIQNTLIFGLSGNPVSSFLQYKILTEPVILKLMGANVYLPNELKLALDSEIVRRKGSRQLYVPVRINEEGKAEKINFNGSAHLNALNQAHGFVIVQPQINLIEKNELVRMILI